MRVHFPASYVSLPECNCLLKKKIPIIASKPFASYPSLVRIIELSNIRSFFFSAWKQKFIHHEYHPPFQWNIFFLTIKKHNKDIPNTTGGSHKEQVQAHIPSHLPGAGLGGTGGNTSFQRSLLVLAIFHGHVQPSFVVFGSVTVDDHLMSKMFPLSVKLFWVKDNQENSAIKSSKHNKFSQIHGFFSFRTVECS